MLRRDGQDLATISAAFSKKDGIRSWCAAELVMLARILEKARDLGKDHEDVIVRTGLQRIVDLCQSRSSGLPPHIRDAVDRLANVARDFDSIHAEIRPGWVTARAQAMALRAVLQQATTCRSCAAAESGEPA